MVELVDTLAWGASSESCACSSQVLRRQGLTKSQSFFLYMEKKMLAVFVNCFAVIIGSAIGIIFSKKISGNMSEIIQNAAGIITVVLGLQMAFQFQNIIYLYYWVVGWTLKCCAWASLVSPCSWPWIHYSLFCISFFHRLSAELQTFKPEQIEFLSPHPWENLICCF